MALATGDLVVALLGAYTILLGQAIARLPAPDPGDPLEASTPPLSHYKARLAGTGLTVTGLATIIVALAAGYTPATIAYIIGVAITIAATLLLPPRKAEELLLSQPPEPGEGPPHPHTRPEPTGKARSHHNLRGPARHHPSPHPARGRPSPPARSPHPPTG